MTGGAGFARDSRVNYEKNLQLFDKLKASHFKRSNYSHSKKIIYKYKEASPELLAKIKSDLRLEQKRIRRISRCVFVFLTLLIGSIMVYLIT